MDLTKGINAQPHEQIFRDVITIAPGYVTIIRAKFALNDGSPFQTQLSGGNFLFHCHILEHEDNDMMSRMCIIWFIYADNFKNSFNKIDIDYI